MRAKPIILVLVATLFSAAAQILFKFASENISISVELLTNIELIVGLAVYFFAAIAFILALREGELTVIYPILATTYIWVAIASPFFFPTDSLNTLKIIGILVIIVGVYFTSRGIKHPVEVI